MRKLKHLILQKNVKGGALVFSTSNLLQNMKNRNENLWKHQKRLEKNLTVPKVRKGFFSLVRFCWLRLQWRKWYREPFALRYVPAGWSGSSVKSVHSAYILLADKKTATVQVAPILRKSAVQKQDDSFIILHFQSFECCFFKRAFILSV